MADLKIAAPLLGWYDRYARDLPWRRVTSPYRTWVSEIMLQQTRVDTVIPYFERFMAALPDVSSLARADESIVLKLWEGLGYYSRARNLQKAARMVVEEYGGWVPNSPEELRRLPGVGEYIAGAIASIAFSQRVPAVDGNVLRVFSRLLASREDIANPQTKSRIYNIIQDILPQDRAGDFNQALMDLGATVCVPGETPRCEACPLAGCCKGCEAGIQGELPVKAPQKPRDIRDITVIIVRSKGKALLVRRPQKGLLAGLWGPVVVDEYLDEKQAAEWLGSHGAVIHSVRRVEDAKHVFTHVEWNIRAYLAETDGFAAEGEPVWAGADDLQQYAIPSAFKAYRSYF